MSLYQFDVTITERDLSPEQRSVVERATRARFSRFGDHVVERWNDDDAIGHLRVVGVISEPIMASAVDKLASTGFLVRGDIGLHDSQSLVVSVAVRDVAYPLERLLPPVFTPRRESA
jgi:hypothetical protein